MKYLTGRRLLLILGSTTVALTAAMMLFFDFPPGEEASIFGHLSLKKSGGIATQVSQTNYHAIRHKGKQQRGEMLRYKARKKKENPFFSFYKEKQTESPRKRSVKISKKKSKKQEGFFTSYNSDTKPTKSFYEAIFIKSQNVQDGKPLSILLQEAIPSLHLDSGTVLKGIPYLEGSRIGIKITAAVCGEKVHKVALVCYDKEDCVEGLYHDALAARLSHDIKETLLEELWDLDEDELSGRAGKLAQRGSRVVRRLSSLSSNNVKITIPQGKVLFVALSKKTQ